MIRIAIYEVSTGRIQRVLSCPSDLASLQAGQGEAFIEVQGAVSDETHMVIDGSIVEADPRNLDEIRAAQWLQIKDARKLAEEGGFAYDGSMFDSHQAAQQAIQAAAQAALLSQLTSTDYSIDWTLADNSTRTLMRTEMLAVAAALTQHKAEVHAESQRLRSLIEAANTLEEVLAVQFSSK